jgi:hypothetical protein
LLTFLHYRQIEKLICDGSLFVADINNLKIVLRFFICFP